ncbi:hypothetical protein DM860_012355 [Cuscuta australis]|uniref:DUF4378 domain-containing protein n=1 Tax=Cuscuta australis TaxID=267555 RepID=A0A328DR40_9ASTE|nr:hypothetical protein DM860_012355 [Cuscuta australis]
MNGIQKGQNLEEHFSGCLGRMVNLYNLNDGSAGNELLTDKPYQDGFPPMYNSNVASLSPYNDQTEDNEIVSKSSENILHRKSNVTPMKMLLAQEMSKEINNKHNPPSVVAKLMGLDTPPSQQPDSSKERYCVGGSARVHTDTHLSYCNNKSGTLNGELQHDFHQCSKQNQFKDVNKVWQHQQKSSLRNKSSGSGRCDEKDKRTAYVRQKFIEAKSLSIDEKCRQTNNFQGALEVLSSNPDLLLKFLQEPNPTLAQQISNLRSCQPPTDIKRITVLRPSKMVDNHTYSGKETNEKKDNKANEVSQLNKIDESYQDHFASTARHSVDGSSAQPTRIVVLKPSTGKCHNLKVVSSPPCISPARFHHENVSADPEDNGVQELRELATEITQHMHENSIGHERDDILLSSVFLDGYISDVSSFDKSENEHAMENLSDSEFMSPASRHSWEFINRCRSPHSLSSPRPSHSPESLVSREAKKRLSERLAMVASNGICQEQRPHRRSSSTLGEMLSLSYAKKSGKRGGGGDKEPSDLSFNQVGGTNIMEGVDNSLSLLRSQSVPVPSTMFASKLKVESSESETVKTNPGEGSLNERIIKFSFKGKVSGLFSWNKKPSNQKLDTSKYGNESHFGEKYYLDSRRKENQDMSQCLDYVHGSTGKRTSSGLTGRHVIISSEVDPGPSVKKDWRPGNLSESQDQPSPISVLGTSFEDDESVTQVSLDNIKQYGHGELPGPSTNFNPIDKSPPIGSISRMLSLSDSCLFDAATSFSLKQSSIQRAEEEHKWFIHVQTILSEAGLDDMQYDSFLSRWHSPESSLDPSLKDKYVDSHDEESSLHEAKRRKMRSTKKLIFDCVNAVLMDISCQNTFPCSVISADHVLGQMREWFSWNNMIDLSEYNGDRNCLVAEKMIEKETMGNGWIQHWRLEREMIGKEIEGKLLDEIVREAVVEMMK